MENNSGKPWVIQWPLVALRHGKHWRVCYQFNKEMVGVVDLELVGVHMRSVLLAHSLLSLGNS